MRFRSFVSIGLAGAFALGCAVANLPHYEQSRELSVAGDDPFGPGGTEDRIVHVLESRRYTLQRVWESRFWSYSMNPGGAWGVRLRSDGWDQIEVRRAGGEGARGAAPPVTYRWIVRARTFNSAGVEQAAAPEARSDVDSILAALRIQDPSTDAGKAEHAIAWNVVSRDPSTCSGGHGVGAFTGLPPWAGAPPSGANADRVVATLEADGWDVTERFPSASLGMLVAQRARTGGTDAVTVLAIRNVDPTFRDVRVWYEVRAASCDSSGHPGSPDTAAREGAKRLVESLRGVVAGAPSTSPSS